MNSISTFIPPPDYSSSQTTSTPPQTNGENQNPQGESTKVTAGSSKTPASLQSLAQQKGISVSQGQNINSSLAQTLGADQGFLTSIDSGSTEQNDVTPESITQDTPQTADKGLSADQQVAAKQQFKDDHGSDTGSGGQSKREGVELPADTTAAPLHAGSAVQLRKAGGVFIKTAATGLKSDIAGIMESHSAAGINFSLKVDQSISIEKNTTHAATTDANGAPALPPAPNVFAMIDDCSQLSTKLQQTTVQDMITATTSMNSTESDEYSKQITSIQNAMQAQQNSNSKSNVMTGLSWAMNITMLVVGCITLDPMLIAAGAVGIAIMECPQITSGLTSLLQDMGVPSPEADIMATLIIVIGASIATMGAAGALDVGMEAAIDATADTTSATANSSADAATDTANDAANSTANSTADAANSPADAADSSADAVKAQSTIASRWGYVIKGAKAISTPKGLMAFGRGVLVTAPSKAAMAATDSLSSAATATGDAMKSAYTAANDAMSSAATTTGNAMKSTWDSMTYDNLTATLQAARNTTMEDISKAAQESANYAGKSVYNSAGTAATSAKTAAQNAARALYLNSIAAGTSSMASLSESANSLAEGAKSAWNATTSGVSDAYTYTSQELSEIYTEGVGRLASKLGTGLKDGIETAVSSPFLSKAIQVSSDLVLTALNTTQSVVEYEATELEAIAEKDQAEVLISKAQTTAISQQIQLANSQIQMVLSDMNSSIIAAGQVLSSMGDLSSETLGNLHGAA
jgi:hypothetical protein